MKGSEAMGTGGRPPKYKSVKTMQKKIDEYFKLCEGEVLKEDGKIVRNKSGYPIMINRKPPTITGLALHLGFTSRADLLYYQNEKQEFLDTITRAKSRVEEYAEGRLYDKEGSSGAQFNLRNNFKHWDADKKQEENKTEGITIVNNIPRE
ncbi:DNA-packaging protein [Anaerostipes hadrus]|uniref:DNA-packaging protein n=1 Tax=Anaerostipes hadrus TaxID=649756 RepID=UPI00210DCF47|nr:DNA-packaging protein [Anaerostipes hadrus]MCQ5016852.1 DNA-packaging protein [Anaerostipes hadrus]